MDRAVLLALREGKSIVTATRRLSYEVKAAYDADQLARGLKVWPTAKLHTWSSWMQSLWQAHSAHTTEICLNAAQLQHLVQTVIEGDLSQATNSSNDLNALFSIASSAALTIEAWTLCHEWNISFRDLKYATHVDHVQFGRWASKLSAHLRDKNWICEAEIASTLVAQQTKVATKASLLGFDFLNQQQQTWLDYCSTEGLQIEQLNNTPSRQTSAVRYVFNDIKDEWRQIGAWARKKLEQNPNQTIGIITPNAEKTRELAQRCLREQLTPDFYQETHPDPFHFSQGISLATVPLIKSALACLDLLAQLEYQQLASIFTSKYWGNDKEQSARAALIAKIGRKLAYRFDLFQLIQALKAVNKHQADHAESDNPSAAASFIGKLVQLQEIKAANRSRQSLSSWRDVFQQCFAVLAWPRSQLSSAEYQANEAWHNCLDGWVRLDLVCPPITLQGAINNLKAHCQKIQFQPQAHANTPIQIMGVLETAELDFDSLWLTGFDDQSWPSNARANPFLPIQTQIKAGIHEASNELQLQHASLKTQQLLSLSTEIHISHTSVQDDLNLEVSPLLSDVPLAELSTLPTPFNLHQSIRAATPALTLRDDNQGMAATKSQTKGGTGLITAQSACPFQAYAKYRLRADALQAPEIGLDNLDRGSLLHEILATIWHELKTSQSLTDKIADGSIAKLIHDTSTIKLTRYVKASGFGQGYIDSECARLTALISEWLTMESGRPAFKVESIEAPHQVNINGLELSLVLDRVDQLQSPQGDLVVMDYKSGKCELKDWASDRLKQPQIPLYYLALNALETSPPIAALAFSQVKQGECAFVGISESQTHIEGIQPYDQLGKTSLKKEFDHWPELHPGWRSHLEKLAAEYKAGVANVDPKESSSCQICDFSSLCRVGVNKEVDNDAD